MTGKTTSPTKPKTDRLVGAVTEAATAMVTTINHPGVPQPQTPPKSANSHASASYGVTKHLGTETGS